MRPFLQWRSALAGSEDTFPPKKQFLGLFPEPGTPPTQVLEKKYSKNLHLRYYLNIWYKNLQVVIMEFCWLLSIVNFCQQ